MIEREIPGRPGAVTWAASANSELIRVAEMAHGVPLATLGVFWMTKKEPI